jgi:hypothetical protein
MVIVGTFVPAYMIEEGDRVLSTKVDRMGDQGPLRVQLCWLCLSKAGAQRSGTISESSLKIPEERT